MRLRADPPESADAGGRRLLTRPAPRVAGRLPPIDSPGRPGLPTHRCPAKTQHGQPARRAASPSRWSCNPVWSRHHHNVWSVADRARLGWVSDQETAVQLVDAGPLETNIADLVTRQAKAQPQGVALVQPRPAHRSMTWAELNRRIDAHQDHGGNHRLKDTGDEVKAVADKAQCTVDIVAKAAEGFAV